MTKEEYYKMPEFYAAVCQAAEGARKLKLLATSLFPARTDIDDAAEDRLP
jgi:hypothetical protein